MSDNIEPECRSGHEHDWRSPYSVLGGIRENPGVWGHGAGAIIREICSHCGVYRVTDTWAQDLETGEQGLTSIRYEDADDRSIEWVEQQMLDHAEKIMEGLDYVVRYRSDGTRLEVTLTDPDRADDLDLALGDDYGVAKSDDDPVVTVYVSI